MPVSQLKRVISSREFTQWQAYFQIEPYGHVADDIRMARLMAIVAGIAGNSKAKPKDFLITDMTEGNASEQAQDWQTMKRHAQIYAAALARHGK